jgi:hypothetical protein
MPVAIVEPPTIPEQREAIQSLNWQYLIAAREGLRAHYELARERYGLDPQTANWIREATDLDFALACERAHTLFRLLPHQPLHTLADLSDNTAAMLDAIDAAGRLGGGVR